MNNPFLVPHEIMNALEDSLAEALSNPSHPIVVAAQTAIEKAFLSETFLFYCAEAGEGRSVQVNAIGTESRIHLDFGYSEQGGERAFAVESITTRHGGVQSIKSLINYVSRVDLPPQAQTPAIQRLAATFVDGSTSWVDRRSGLDLYAIQKELRSRLITPILDQK